MQSAPIIYRYVLYAVLALLAFIGVLSCVTNVRKIIKTKAELSNASPIFENRATFYPYLVSALKVEAVVKFAKYQTLIQSIGKKLEKEP